MKIWLILIGLLFVLPFSPAKAVDDPSEDMRCWTKEVCNSSGGSFDGDGDKKTAAAESACGSGEYSFCYPQAKDYTLGVSLPVAGRVITSVSDLGDYIDKAYKFLLAFSTIFAVLMLMVGGLQYVSSPSGGEISKAKERITRSLTGLVLLMCAALILFTINPHLINLEMPRIPKIRTVFFIDDATTCESLQTADYKVEVGSDTNCGTLSKITAGPSGQLFEEEDQETCHWSACAGNKGCLSADNKTYQCLSCEEISDGSSNKILVSPSTCSRLEPTDQPNSDGTLKIGYYCFMTNDTNLRITPGSDCALATVECSSIKECEDYEDVPVKSASDASETLNDIQSGSGSDLGLEDICKDDPCKIGPKTNTTCMFESDYYSFVGITPVAIVAGLIIANDDCFTVSK